MLKIATFFVMLILLQLVVTLPSFALFHTPGAIFSLISLNSVFFLILLFAPHCLMGQLNGRMASASTHLEDFLLLETISRQYGVRLPALYIHESNQMNAYLVKGPISSPMLAVSSECFSLWSLEERGQLYKYQMMRLQFPWHLYIETGISILLLLNIWLIDFLFLPFNIIRRRFLGIEKNDLQQAFKLISLPFLSFCKNMILGPEKHSYLKSILTKTTDLECFIPIYFRAKQSFYEKGLEYDFLSCNGFMGLENDIFSSSTEKQEFKNYMWEED